ncbi:hypothetical protein EJ08DRAFT_656424 [Tothia fuscella]|uniref:Uncharacterized protein n=1 Tax=Tothia fuscella TaxID=1048955 RepID=A0A9P4P164_9PEZI|nr:hypothetical protein EJ08DRAFT_656424 [Tothia fuscella]
MELDLGIDTDVVQRAIPNLRGLRDTHGFSQILANSPHTATSEPGELKRVLKNYAIQLERHESEAEMWQRQYRNQLFSLKTFVAELDTKCRHINKAAAKLELTQGKETAEARYARHLEHIGTAEFEDLYYLLACKTRSLYCDLQTRFASNFVDLDYVIHECGPTSYDKAPCTVRDMRNLLRAIWFHLLHPNIIKGIETAIHARKYKYLKANPLLPANFYEMSYDEQEAFNERSHAGDSLAESSICQMFEHLEDISDMSVPAILDKVFRRRIGAPPVADESDERRRQQNYEEAHARTSWMLLKEDEEDYIQSEIARSETPPSVGDMPHKPAPPDFVTHKSEPLGQELFDPRLGRPRQRHSFQGSFGQRYLSPTRFNPAESRPRATQQSAIPRPSNVSKPFRHSHSASQGQIPEFSQDTSPNRYTYPNGNHSIPLAYPAPTFALSQPTRSPPFPTVSTSVAALQKMTQEDLYTPGTANWPLEVTQVDLKAQSTAQHTQLSLPVFRPSPARNASAVDISAKHLSLHASPAMPTSIGPPAIPSASLAGPGYFRGARQSDSSKISYGASSLSHRHQLNSDDSLGPVASAAVAYNFPPRSSSKRAQSLDRNPNPSPTTAVKVEKWLPGVRNSQHGQITRSTPRKTLHHFESSTYKTPTTAVKQSSSGASGRSYQCSPLDRRIPFHGDAQYGSGERAVPPELPPKSDIQLQQAENAREGMKLMQSKIDILQRENSQLHEFLQRQNSKLVRENSQLQEHMQRMQMLGSSVFAEAPVQTAVPQNATKTPATSSAMSSERNPRSKSPTKSFLRSSTKSPAKCPTTPETPTSSSGNGIFRKLSKLGSRSGRSSPRKSLF